MKKITLFAMMACCFGASELSAQFIVKPTFFETLGISNDGVISGYEAFSGPYSIWNPDEETFYEIGGVAPGDGVGGATRFSADGNYMSGTSHTDQAIPTNWNRTVLSSFNYIFKDIEFPENQAAFGYAAGTSSNSSGNGMLLKTADGGQTWSSLWADTSQHGLESMSFPTIYTGYVGGWNDYLAKTTNGGNDWTLLDPVAADVVWYYTAVAFKDEVNGVVTAKLDSGLPVVYTTSDGGATWNVGSGLVASPVKVTYVQGNTYFLVTNNKIQKSTDGGMTWTTVHSTSETLNGINFYNEMTGIATGYQYIYKTTDGGATWTQQSISEGTTFRDVKWLTATNIVIAGSPDSIYSSVDGGATWTWDNQPLFNGSTNLLSIAVTSDAIHICGSQGNFYKKSRISSLTVAEMSRYNISTDEWTALGNLGQVVSLSTGGGYCISADGNTVVGNAWVAPTVGTTPYAHGFAWSETEGQMDLGSIYASINRSTRANAVSGNGEVIVGYQDFNGPWKSAVWKKNPAGGYFANQFLLIDPNGSATDQMNQLGECTTVTPDGNWIGGDGDFATNNLPWIWSESTGVITLGDITNGTARGRVSGISPDGNVVVGWFRGSGFGAQVTPFIWTPTTGIQNLNTYIAETLNFPMGNNVVKVPNNMSLNGKFLTGWGLDPTIGDFGATIAFRLELPQTLGVNGSTINSVTVYPNPVNTNFKIIGIETKDSIENYNVRGQLLLTQKSHAITQVDLSTLSNGIYFVKTYAGNISKTHKVIKQ
jgi:hypothetical protein